MRKIIIKNEDIIFLDINNLLTNDEMLEIYEDNNDDNSNKLHDFLGDIKKSDYIAINGNNHLDPWIMIEAIDRQFPTIVERLPKIISLGDPAVKYPAKSRLGEFNAGDHGDLLCVFKLSYIQDRFPVRFDDLDEENYLIVENFSGEIFTLDDPDSLGDNLAVLVGKSETKDENFILIPETLDAGEL